MNVEPGDAPPAERREHAHEGVAHHEPGSGMRLVLLATLAVGAMATLFVYLGGEGELQRGFDRQRLERQRALAARIVRFRDAIGRCPLGPEANGQRVAVLLSHEPATADEAEPPRLLPASRLRDELARIERSPAPLPIDPEKHGWMYRRSIRYETDGARFAVGTSLYHAHAGAERLGRRRHELTLVGSCVPGSGPPVPSRPLGTSRARSPGTPGP
ncbi:MAG: hypothetical protein U0230_25290 [Polyangiales bacterium]